MVWDEYSSSLEDYQGYNDVDLEDLDDDYYEDEEKEEEE